jgi:hypothetical protein
MVFPNNFNKYIYIVINNVFPKLPSGEKNYLSEYLQEILNYISIRYDFDETQMDKYMYQLKQNKDRDIRALLNLLLPFIDDEQDIKKKKLTSLSKLYSEVENGKYVYTNIQYSRCIRKEKKFDPIPFHMNHIDHNVNILKRTIYLSANKSFINWMNIFPITMEDYKQRNIYKNTIELVENNLVELDNINYNKCILPLNDIYNTIVHDLYERVKDIKWLIYEKIINGKITPFVVILNSYVNLDNLIADKKWEYLNKVEQTKFTKEWLLFLETSESDGVVGKVFKGLFVFFQNKYSAVDTLVDRGLFERFEFVEDLNELYDTETRYSKINSISLLKNIRRVPPKYIYEFLYQMISKFKKTWYFNNSENYITKDNQTKFKKIGDNCFIEQLNQNKWLTLKNIYNFSKSLHHVYIEKSDSYSILSKYYTSIITENDSNIILNRFMTDDINDILTWFNISNYIKSTYGQIDPSIFDSSLDFKTRRKNINNYIVDIRESITNNRLVNIVFEILIKKGVLSYFEPNRQLTDESLLPKDYLPKTKKISELLKKNTFNKKNRKKYEKAYYFLTEDKYSNLKIQFEDNKYKNYFDLIIDSNWMYTYAMDWISQINFFHHYINNRVILVTGSTGVGKSTQVPKLLLYALKSISYKFDGKVICTQPRVPPTENVPANIGESMGVPLKNFSKIYKKEIQSDNFYIQFKHQKNNHSNRNQQYYLKMVTDGTLFQELINSPLCKKMIPLREPDGKIIKEKNEIQKESSIKNLYDIIIVDEAHEHNTNMDMILTVARNSAYYNNDLKIVIISATMDDDEANYRRYFRCINDNRSYPFDTFLQRHNLDRINVDRRYHISPPGMTTRFKIDEHYEKNLSIKKWDNAYELGKQKVINICNTTRSGDILFFVTGKKEIMDAVKHLNQNIPNNIVCLPYHGQLSEEDKILVEKINIKLKNYTIHKDNIGLDEDDIKNNKSVTAGTYTRAVIVATNVAEASLTITSLKYVVDTGYAKVGKYNSQLGSSILLTKEISESSRKQRKGRVGRVSDGTVYYTYEKGDREMNLTEYNIANDDIYGLLYNLLCDEYDEDNLISKIYDPNNYKNIITENECKKLYNEYKKYESKIRFDIKNIIINQYLVLSNANFTIYNYYGVIKDGENVHHHDYDFTGFGYRPPDYKQTGYDKKTLLDISGDFYLIHPDEDKIQKNDIRIKVIEEIKYKNFISKKMLNFFVIMKNKLLIKDRESKDDYLIYPEQVDDDKIESITIRKKVYKTEYGKNVMILASSLNLYNLEDIIPYLYAGNYGCRNEVLHILCMINTGGGMQKNMKKLYGYYEDNGRKKYYINEFKGLYTNKYSDYTTLYNIYKKIYEKFDKLLIFGDIDLLRLRNEFNNYKEIYLKYIVDGEKEVQKHMEKKIYIEFKNLEKAGALNTDWDYDMYISDKYKYLIEEIDKFKNDIVIYSKSLYLNEETIITYLKEYAIKYYLIKYNNYKKEKKLLEDPLEEIIDIDWFDKNLVTISSEDININIIYSFIHAIGNNLGKMIDNDNYVNVFQKQILNFGRIIRKKQIYDYTVKDKSNYILYHGYSNMEFEDTEITTVGIISNLSFDWISEKIPFIFDNDDIIKKEYINTPFYKDNPNNKIKVLNTLKDFVYDLTYNNQKGGSQNRKLIIKRKDNKYKYIINIVNNRIVLINRKIE